MLAPPPPAVRAGGAATRLAILTKCFDVNRFYPKTQLSWLARLDHSHCNSADPLTDWLEVCCVFYRPGPGGAMCVVWWWKVMFLCKQVLSEDSTQLKLARLDHSHCKSAGG